MNGIAFDRITTMLAQRLSRRGAVVAGSAGIGAVLSSSLAGTANAQSATPLADATPVADGQIDLLFVQTFPTATIEPVSDETGAMTLTLENGSGHTIYFSDRPDRLAGTLSDEQFLDSQAFDPADPPNAAIVTLSDGTERVVIVELTEPVLDATSGAVTYTVRPLADQPEGAELASLASRETDQDISEISGPVTLFIDELTCSPSGAACNKNSDCCSGFCCNDIEICPPGICT